MSQDVPTFGRENLPTEAERAEWDYWAELHQRGWTKPNPRPHFYQAWCRCASCLTETKRRSP